MGYYEWSTEGSARLKRHQDVKGYYRCVILFQRCTDLSQSPEEVPTKISNPSTFLDIQLAQPVFRSAPLWYHYDELLEHVVLD